MQSLLFQVKAKGKGLDHALISRQNSFTVDCGRAGNNVLYVGVYGPDIPCDEVVIKHQGEKKYSVSYVVHQKGEYMIFVKWGDEHVPGSPFRVVAWIQHFNPVLWFSTFCWLLLLFCILFPPTLYIHLTKILLILQEETKQKQNLNWVKNCYLYFSMID